MNILELNLGASISNTLNGIGIKTIKDLAESNSEDIRSIPNLGKCGSMKLARALAILITEQDK